MFKKLKQKISEEQAPPRGAGGRAAPLQPQVPPKSPPLSDKRSRSSSLAEQNDEGTLTPDKEFLFSSSRQTGEGKNPPQDMSGFAGRTLSCSQYSNYSWNDQRERGAGGSKIKNGKSTSDP